MLIIGLFFVGMTTIFVNRNYILNEMILGEPFDTRLMVIIHEHWFRFFQGKNSFLDVNFFYPYERSFSLTDSFLLTGITHSMFRQFGVDVVDSWVYAQIAWIFIGLFGWFLLGRFIFKNRLLIATFPIFIGTSYAFISHLHERPNVIPYLLVSYVFLYLLKFFKHENSNSQNSINLGITLISIPLIVLTSWYPGFFLSSFLITVLVVLISLNKEFRDILLNKLKKLNLLLLLPFLVVSGLLTALWAYIFIPVLNSVASFRRPIEEVLFGSPRFSEFFVTNSLGGPIIGHRSSIQFELGDEELIGISLNLILIFLLLLCIFVYTNYSNLRNLSNQLLFFSIGTVIFFEILIIKFFEDKSIFIFAWQNISFLKSIRTPVRWHIFATFILITCLFYILNNFLNKKTPSRVFIAVTLLALLLIDQYRLAPGLWKKGDFLNSELLDYKSITNSCSAFILDRPNTGMWKDIIEGMALTIFVEKPSVNGYSGGFPATYPPIDWYGDGDLNALGNWLSDNDALENICILDGIKPYSVINYQENSIQIVLGNGYTGFETNGNDYWAWSVWNSSEFYIYNLGSKDESIRIDFSLSSPDCVSNSILQIDTEDFSRNLQLNQKNTAFYSQEVFIPAWDRSYIRVSSNAKPCTPNGDPRSLFYSIKNIQLSTGNENYRLSNLPDSKYVLYQK